MQVGRVSVMGIESLGWVEAFACWLIRSWVSIGSGFSDPRFGNASHPPCWIAEILRENANGLALNLSNDCWFVGYFVDVGNMTHKLTTAPVRNFVLHPTPLVLASKRPYFR